MSSTRPLRGQLAFTVLRLQGRVKKAAIFPNVLPVKGNVVVTLSVLRVDHTRSHTLVTIYDRETIAFAVVDKNVKIVEGTKIIAGVLAVNFFTTQTNETFFYFSLDRISRTSMPADSVSGSLQTGWIRKHQAARPGILGKYDRETLSPVLQGQKFHFEFQTAFTQWQERSMSEALDWGAPVPGESSVVTSRVPTTGAASVPSLEAHAVSTVPLAPVQVTFPGQPSTYKSWAPQQSVAQTAVRASSTAASQRSKLNPPLRSSLRQQSTPAVLGKSVVTTAMAPRSTTPSSTVDSAASSARKRSYNYGQSYPVKWRADDNVPHLRQYRIGTESSASLQHAIELQQPVGPKKSHSISSQVDIDRPSFTPTLPPTHGPPGAVTAPQEQALAAAQSDITPVSLSNHKVMSSGLPSSESVSVAPRTSSQVAPAPALPEPMEEGAQDTPLPAPDTPEYSDSSLFVRDDERESTFELVEPHSTQQDAQEPYDSPVDFDGIDEELQHAPHSPADESQLFVDSNSDSSPEPSPVDERLLQSQPLTQISSSPFLELSLMAEPEDSHVPENSCFGPLTELGERIYRDIMAEKRAEPKLISLKNEQEILQFTEELPPSLLPDSEPELDWDALYATLATAGTHEVSIWSSDSEEVEDPLYEMKRLSESYFAPFEPIPQQPQTESSTGSINGAKIVHTGGELPATNETTTNIPTTENTLPQHQNHRTTERISLFTMYKGYEATKHDLKQIEQNALRKLQC